MIPIPLIYIGTISKITSNSRNKCDEHPIVKSVESVAVSVYPANYADNQYPTRNQSDNSPSFHFVFLLFLEQKYFTYAQYSYALAHYLCTK